MRHPWGKLLHIKCVSPLRECKTLESNMGLAGIVVMRQLFLPLLCSLLARGADAAERAA
jgi:hypothetical protein